MSHEIGELDTPMYGSRKPAWHGLGTVVEGQPSSREALKLAGLDWTVEKETCYYRSGESTYFDAPDIRLICRGDLPRNDNRRVLGAVGPKYEPIQNVEAFEIADALVGEGGAQFESAGSLKNGKIVWLLASMPEKLRVKDDSLSQYLLIRTSHDGSKALEVMPTTVRVVCWNTLSIAVRGKGNRIPIRHKPSWKTTVERAVTVLQEADVNFHNVVERMNTLAEKKVDQVFVKAYLEALVPSNGSGKSETTAKNRRARIAELFAGGQAGADQEAVQGTAYGLLNAVTEWIDHEKTSRACKGRSTEEARFDSVMFGQGSRLRNTAIRLLEKATGIGDGPSLVEEAVTAN